MKILLLNSLYTPNSRGGAERSTQALAEGLKSRGLEPVVVSTSDRDARGHVNDIRVYYLNVPNLYWMYTAKQQPLYKKPLWHLLDSYNPFVMSRLSRIIQEERPALVHTNNLSGFSVRAWQAARGQGLSIVHTIRDHYLLCPNTVMYKHDHNCETQCRDCRLFSLPRRILSADVDAVVGVSRFILEKHLKFGFFKNARVRTHIYNAAEVPATRERSYDKSRPLVLGYVGGLHKVKGIEVLLEAFRKMAPEGIVLKVFGQGQVAEYENRLRETYQSDRIEFMGHQEPGEIYPQLDLVVIPSLCDDAFPRIVIEAYSHGLPLIATSRGGAAEMVREGKTGYVFDPDRPGHLEEQIRRFQDDPGLAARMSKSCLESAEEFVKQRVVDAYLKVYGQLIG